MGAHLLRTSCLLLVLAVALPAQASQLPLSYLHQVLLDRAPVIVRARLPAGQGLPRAGFGVVRFQAVEFLKGSGPSRLLVAGMGERARAWRRLEKILFLQPMSSGSLFRLVDLVDLTSTEGVARLDTIRFHLGLGRLQNPALAARRLRSRALVDLSAQALFARRVAVRDLGFLVRTRPQVFRPEDLSVLTGFRRALPAPEQHLFEAVLARLSDRLAIPFSGLKKVFRDPLKRAAFLQASAALKGTHDPELRVQRLNNMVRMFRGKLRLFCERLLSDRTGALARRAAFFLGEFGAERTVPVLLRTLEGADQPLARSILQALGKIGDLSALAALTSSLERSGLMDPALVALARIGGPEADTILAHLERVLRDLPGASEHRKLLDSVRSKTFKQSETARRRAARLKYGR